MRGVLCCSRSWRPCDPAGAAAGFTPIPTLSRCGHSAHALGKVRQACVQSSMYDHKAHTPRPLVSLLPSAPDLAQVTPLQFPNLLLLVCIPKHAVWACFGPVCDWNSAVSWPFPGHHVSEICPRVPSRPWDQEVAQSSPCGYLAACRCLIPGRHAHTQTRSLHLNFQTPASTVQQNLLFI